jgi:predicted RNase H-like nuclease (RuvC/YqgF family)
MKNNFELDKSKDIIINGNAFDLVSFQKKLKENQLRLNKIQNAKFWEKPWNIITGKNFDVMIDSLDINNQFMEFSNFVYDALMFSAVKNHEHRVKTESLISSRDESLDYTEKQLVNITNELNIKLKEVENYTNKLRDFESSILSNSNRIEELLIQLNDTLQKVNENKINNEQNHSELKKMINDLKSIKEDLASFNYNLSNLKSSLIRSNNKLNNLKKYGVVFLVCIVITLVIYNFELFK